MRIKQIYILDADDILVHYNVEKVMVHSTIAVVIEHTYRSLKITIQFDLQYLEIGDISFRAVSYKEDERGIIVTQEIGKENHFFLQRRLRRC